MWNNWSFGQWALAQMALPPFVRASWSLRSWVQYSLGSCVTYPYTKKLKTKGKIDLFYQSLINDYKAFWDFMWKLEFGV